MDNYDEDGEIKRNRPIEDREDDAFSMSSYDGEQVDSLIIKPPQAIVQHRDKRDKKDKRERHKHKSDKHKDKHRSREHGSSHEERERKREHRRHKEAERREKRHEKSKDRPSKHERSESRKLQKERRRERAREREELYMESRDIYDGREREYMRGHGGSQMYHHRDRRHDERAYMAQDLMNLQLSPRERTERDKRMEKFLLAERQKEIIQKEADVRRQRKDEEKMEELRRRAEASMLRHREKSSSYNRSKPSNRLTKLSHAPETVELISDDDFKSEEEIVEHEEADDKQPRKNKEEDDHPMEEESKGKKKSPKSSSSSSSESDSSTSSSSDDDEEEEEEEEEEEAAKEQNEKETEAVQNNENKSNASGSSGESTEEERNSDEDDRNNDDYLNDSPLQSPPEMKPKLPIYYPAIMGCRSVDEFECLNRIEEGTYGVVYRAREKSTNGIVALKRLKMEKEKEGFPITSLREVNTLLKGQHENIVTVREIVVGSNMDKIYIVMDYVEHDLKSLMETMKGKKQTFTISEVKTLMIQLLRAVRHLHDNWILHRDLKTSNLLLSHRGILKVGDFGLAREYGSPLKHYTPIVVTLWYRAPELLLGTKMYSCPIDMWSCGCIFGELLGMEPMFSGKSDIDQLNKIFKDLGTPSDKIWPGYNDFPVTKKTQFAYYPYNHLKERYKSRLSDEGFKLFNGFLTYNPSRRITSSEALNHDYFHNEEPAPISPSMFPTWPAKSENPHGARSKKGNSPKPPSGGKMFKDLGNEEENIGFFLGGAPSSGPGFTLKF